MSRSREDIAIFANVRLSSRRCPGKMLRPFAGSTLTEIGLNRLDRLGWPRVYFGAHEPELLSLAEGHTAIPIKRSFESANENDSIPKIFEILESIPTRWVMSVNFCVPTISDENILHALKLFMKYEYESMTSVKRVYGWFFDSARNPINDMAGCGATEKAEPIFQVAHAFHIYDRERMLKTGQWCVEPFLYEIPSEEAWDIDTEQDFIAAERIYESIQAGRLLH